MALPPHVGFVHGGFRCEGESIAALRLSPEIETLHSECRHSKTQANGNLRTFIDDHLSDHLASPRDPRDDGGSEQAAIRMLNGLTQQFINLPWDQVVTQAKALMKGIQDISTEHRGQHGTEITRMCANILYIMAGCTRDAEYARRQADSYESQLVPSPLKMQGEWPSPLNPSAMSGRHPKCGAGAHSDMPLDISFASSCSLNDTSLMSGQTQGSGRRHSPYHEHSTAPHAADEQHAAADSPNGQMSQHNMSSSTVDMLETTVDTTYDHADFGNESRSSTTHGGDMSIVVMSPPDLSSTQHLNLGTSLTSLSTSALGLTPGGGRGYRGIIADTLMKTPGLKPRKNRVADAKYNLETLPEDKSEEHLNAAVEEVEAAGEMPSYTDFEVIKRINRGAYGNVYLAKDGRKKGGEPKLYVNTIYRCSASTRSCATQLKLVCMAL